MNKVISDHILSCCPHCNKQLDHYLEEEAVYLWCKNKVCDYTTIIVIEKDNNNDKSN